MRSKNILINLGSSYAHIVLSVGMNILYIPIALHYLGTERYGTWIVLQTMVSFLTIANFGIPTAVTNLLAQSNQDIEKGGLFLKGFKILSYICFALLLVGMLFFFGALTFSTWLNNFTNEIRLSSLILMAFFILRVPFQISSSVFIAENKVYISKIFEFASILVNFLSLIVLIYFKEDLVFLSILSGCSLLLINIISFIIAVKISKIDNIFRFENNVKAVTIYKPGLSLFAAGMGSLIVWNTDNIIVSRYLDFQQVAVYSTAFRLFSFSFMAFGLFFGVIIPYYGRYFREKNWIKLERFFTFNIIAIPFIAVCVWLIGWLFAKDIIFLWLGDYKLYGGSLLYFFLGAYGLVFACVCVMSNLLTTLNLLKGLVYITIFEAIVNLIASVALVQTIGVEGVALGTLIGTMSVPLIFLPIFINKNHVLQFIFPHNKFITSFAFYIIMMLILYFINANEYQFTGKLLFASTYILLFGFFQYFLNKKVLKEVIDLLKN
ncbi:hypothetical protein FFWV33_07710 [Flavobacterium faecale]|uniref:Polysaccharide biosynthesis protein C-terminal domain-containing protein n=1 Tax=Flavobacterium faecale TaxID=1355330 RepID=A0A2S1LCG0_9FLAO|nr:oligosaccharide flippase family protein [Flavobacterium faecale]AWG21424.1 hypothetical protein FFWV33_07710 [Flavobacterium faecale]